MLHNINFFLDSIVKGDLREVKGVRTAPGADLCVFKRNIKGHLDS